MPIDKKKIQDILNRFSQATIKAAMADRPEIMQAAGWDYDKDGDLVQGDPNAEGPRRLSESLSEIASIPFTDMLLDVAGAAIAGTKAYKSYKVAKELSRAVKHSGVDGSRVIGANVPQGRNIFTDRMTNYGSARNTRESYVLLERPNSLSEAEKLGIPKSERNLVVRPENIDQAAANRAISSRSTGWNSGVFTEGEIAAEQNPIVRENMIKSRDAAIREINDTSYDFLNDDDVSSAFAEKLKKYVSGLDDVEILPEFANSSVDGIELQSPTVRAYRRYLSQQGYNTDALTNDELSRFLQQQYNSLVSKQSGKAKGKILWHGSKDFFDNFDLSAIGSNTGNTGAIGPGFYFSNYGAKYGWERSPITYSMRVNNFQPYLIDDIQSIPSGRMMQEKGLLEHYMGPSSGYTKEGVLDYIKDNPVKTNNKMLFVDPSERVPGLFDMDGYKSGFMYRGDRIKSIFPHPSLLEVDDAGNVFMKQRDFAPGKLNFLNGGLILNPFAGGGPEENERQPLSYNAAYGNWLNVKDKGMYSKEYDDAAKALGEATLQKYAGTIYDPMFFWNIFSSSEDSARRFLVSSGIRESEGAKEAAEWLRSYAASPGYDRIRNNQKEWWKARHPYRRYMPGELKDALKGTDWLKKSLSGISPEGIFDYDGYPELSKMTRGKGHAYITVGAYKSDEWPYEGVLMHEMAHIPNITGFATTGVQGEALGMNTNTEEGHDSLAHEKHSDVEGLKYLLFKEGIYDARGDKDATGEDIKKLRDKYPKLRQLQQMTDEQAAWMLNHVANASDKTDTANLAASGGKIHIKPSKRGTFTAAAKKRGKSVQAFASQVLAHKENYSPAMVKKANFARNAAKWHAEGGPLNSFPNGGKFITTLSPEREEAFQRDWQAYAKLHGLAMNPDAPEHYYDYRGFWDASKKSSAINPFTWETRATDGHLPDTYKTPGHPTFSVESVYAKEAPGLAGSWDNGVYIPPVKVDQDSIKLRQRYAESAFNDRAKSGAGALGAFQIMPETAKEYARRMKLEGDLLDAGYNERMRDYIWNDFYNSELASKGYPLDTVRTAKALAMYNWGRGNLAKYLNVQKDNGVDIYGSLDWIEGLPKETRDYINFILLNKDVADTSKTQSAFEKAAKTYGITIPVPVDNQKVARAYGMLQKACGGDITRMTTVIKKSR